MYKAKNHYYKNSKISEAKFRQVIKAFSMEFSATDTASLYGLSTRLRIPDQVCYLIHAKAATPSGTIKLTSNAGYEFVSCPLFSDEKEDQMPAKRLSMRRITEVPRLKWAFHQSQRQIALQCSLSRPCIRDYLHRAEAADLS